MMPQKAENTLYQITSFVCPLCSEKSERKGNGHAYCLKCMPLANRIKSVASQAVKKAIKEGILPKITSETKCVDCGKSAFCYDHRDYTKPLKVVPVCASCNYNRGPGKYIRGKSTPKDWADRRARIRALRAKGWTLDRVGKRYGISRQRVLQIVEGGK